VSIYNAIDDVDACLEQLDCVGSAAQLAEAGVEVDVAQATACAAALETASCDALRPWRGDGPVSVQDAFPACGAIWRGTKVVGESCAADPQCAAGLECAGETCPGQCQPKAAACVRGSCPSDQFCDLDACVARGQRGASCAPGDDFTVNTCADGLYCQFVEGQGQCVDGLPRGSACSDLSYFVCANGDACIDDECRAALPVGASCTGFTDCGLASFCDFAAGGVCAPFLAVGAACTDAAAACGPRGECVDGRCRDVRAPDPAPITTRPTVGDGASCDQANCGPGLACLPSWMTIVEGGSTSMVVAFHCGEMAAPGESCDPGESLRGAYLLSGRFMTACADSVCDAFASWRCVEPRHPGEACTAQGFSFECTSLRCDGGRCADYYSCP
jgi:hypothetical protein